MNSTRGSMSASKTENIEQIILKSINEGVITIDCSGFTRSANPSAERILGMDANTFVSKHFEYLLGPHENVAMRIILTRLIEQSQQTSHAEIVYKRRDGQSVSLAISTSALDIHECSVDLETFVVVMRDISAFKALEKVRKKAVNHLAHELATPISVIQASVGILEQQENIPEKFKRHLGRIARNLDRLLDIENIVEQILYPAHCPIERFNSKENLERIAQNIREKAGSRKIDLRFPETDFVCDRTDPATFETIVTTLVKNAVENTPDSGLVEVKLTHEGSDLILMVEDHGVGITIEDQNFIFEGFHHTQDTDDYATRRPYDFNAGGKGLELLRLKALSESCGFDLSFESSRCIYIPSSKDICPGVIERCPHIKLPDECLASGGSTFYVKFSEGD